MATVLLIEDEPDLCQFLRFIVQKEGHATLEAANGPDGVAMFREHSPDLVFCDVALPGMDGLAVLKKIKELNAIAPVIVMTGAGSTEIAIRAMSFGASEYLVKPFEPAKAIRVLRQILSSIEVPTSSTADLSEETPRNHSLLGKTEAMYEVFKLIGRVANQSSTVLILGESGTGKELVARAIHENGSRSTAPFVVLNCAAIPEALLESELFGYEKGAFTGADRQRTGKFELARDGTLFLDEIGDMSLTIQAKLLRVLQDQEFYRVGGTETVRTNARIIAATNRDLRPGAETGHFREDLFYRLSVALIRLPPLRDRRTDIPLLAEYFLRRASRDLHRPVRGISPAAMEILCRAEWRGNIRELANAIHQAVLVVPGSMIMPEQLSAFVTAADPEPCNALFNPEVIRLRIAERIAAGDLGILPPLLADFEREAITAALDCCGGNLSMAAKHLGIHRVTLKSKVSTDDPK